MSQPHDPAQTIATMRARRQRVGAVALGCLVCGLIGLWQVGGESAWAAASIRIGLVLGSVWLCLPTPQRPAAWAALTPTRVAMIAIAAGAAHRLKWVLPIIGITSLLLWVVRPRRRGH